MEQPGEGDYARTIAPEVFEATNRGKKSVAINLKDPRGRELLERLVVKADVLIEGFRPGTMARLGLSYDALQEINPRLIYASLTGTGRLTVRLTRRPRRQLPRARWRSQPQSYRHSRNPDRRPRGRRHAGRD